MPPEVGVGQVGSDGGGHLLGSDVGRSDERVGVGAGGVPLRQVEAGGREDRLGLRGRVGGKPGDVARAPLEPVGADPGAEDGERSGDDQRDVHALGSAGAGVGSPARARQSRSICRSIAGYTIRCRTGLIAAM